jgi:hypothetical protein
VQQSSAWGGPAYEVSGPADDLVVSDNNEEYLFGDARSDAIYGGKWHGLHLSWAGNDFIWTGNVHMKLA